MGQETAVTEMSSNSGDRSNYNVRALQEIKNSLQPYENDPALGLNMDLHRQHLVAQQLLNLGFKEDTIGRAFLATGGTNLEATYEWIQAQKDPPPPPRTQALSMITQQIIRKPSFERYRATPYLDTNGSTRSDSPSLHDAPPPIPSRERHSSPPPPPIPARDPSRFELANRERGIELGRFETTNRETGRFESANRERGMDSYRDRPLDPRDWAMRGNSPPPPLPPPPSKATITATQHAQRASQVQVPSNLQQIMKRMSPVPISSSRVPTPSLSSTGSHRGTSPAPAHSTSSRGQPVVVQNGPQQQAQLCHQLQAMNLQAPMQPPSYHMGSTNVKLTTPPPPSYHTALQHRQSPTFSGGMASPSIMNGPSPVPSVDSGRAVRLSSPSPSLSKNPPIIMQSVKSTQVQKPVLQTALAPASPTPPLPPKPNSHNVTPPLPPPYTSSVSLAPPPTNHFVPPADLPPPSYHSTMQAMASQRTTPVFQQPFLPYLPDGMEMTTPLAQIPLNEIPLAAESDSPRIVTSLVLELGQASSSRSDSPLSESASRGPTHSPVSFTTVQSEATQDSGLGMSTTSNDRVEMPPPPPPPPPYKLTHQSPIPERKNVSKEREEERRESKVRNYSPAAFKFYMEQHIENVLKSHNQRVTRKLQLEREMSKIHLSEEAQCQMRRMLSQKESNYIRLRRAKMDKTMFKKIRAIGVGAFGEVALVQKIDTNHLYAMKTLRKCDVLKRNQIAHVKAERDILAEADNEWVVKLYYSFQDKDNLYFVMDYIPGGDLMSLLIKLGIFQEDLARFYIAEIICAVESVHKMGFIHRDIKPDNILIDRDGHIKLTDFGLCTGFRWTHNSKYYLKQGDHSRQDSMDPGEDWGIHCRCNEPHTDSAPCMTGQPTILKPLERRKRRQHQRCLAHSLVGTPNYIAPEVLLRTGYTQSCDWWSVGVILYEMIVGHPPFMANTPAETQMKVTQWEKYLTFPPGSGLSKESKDFILKLCTSSERRLGKGGAGDLKVHPFFRGLEYEGIRSQKAPYRPHIRHATDTSNFDDIDEDRLYSNDINNGTLDSETHPLHAFFEFTFRRFFDGDGHAYPIRLMEDNNNGQSGPVYV